MPRSKSICRLPYCRGCSAAVSEGNNFDTHLPSRLSSSTVLSSPSSWLLSPCICECRDLGDAGSGTKLQRAAAESIGAQKNRLPTSFQVQNLKGFRLRVNEAIERSEAPGLTVAVINDDLPCLR
ncbi:hypothetical protein EYF80_020970 [Liparis tanakae]|uniref:Uncharacterized protein n=1 Tax=Liparis tanakae TaxID=230148 RepID=A0A4Z2HV36_9TELE|nr:hypothetical protein EYF80_020970 [Liparis tanakae]